MPLPTPTSPLPPPPPPSPTTADHRPPPTIAALTTKSLSAKHAAEFSQLANELGVSGKIEEAEEVSEAGWQSYVITHLC